MSDGLSLATVSARRLQPRWSVASRANCSTLAAQRARAGGQTGNVRVVPIDVTLAGVWHQRRSGRKIAGTVEPFGRLSAARRRAVTVGAHA